MGEFFVFSKENAPPLRRGGELWRRLKGRSPYPVKGEMEKRSAKMCSVF